MLFVELIEVLDKEATTVSVKHYIINIYNKQWTT